MLSNSCTKQAWAPGPQCFPGAGVHLMMQHPHPRPRWCPLHLGLTSPWAKHTAVSWVLAARCGGLGHSGKCQSYGHRPSGAECVGSITFPPAERGCQSSSNPVRLGQVEGSHDPGGAGCDPTGRVGQRNRFGNQEMVCVPILASRSWDKLEPSFPWL